MSKTTNTPEAKPAKKYAKTRGEHAKDLIICALIVGIVAFIGGVVFANKQQAEVANAVKSAQAAVTPTAEAVPAPASK